MTKPKLETIFDKQNKQIATLLEKAECARTQGDNNTLLLRLRLPQTAPGSPSTPLYYQVSRRLNGFSVVLDVIQIVLTGGELVPTPEAPRTRLYMNTPLTEDSPVINAWAEALSRTSDADEMTNNTLQAGALRALRLLGVVENERSA